MEYTDKNKKEMKNNPDKKIEVGDHFILDIKRMGINGEGIGFYNRMAVFVEGAIPGEGHEIEITKNEGKMAFGKTVLLKHASEFRKEAECPYYKECGGCSSMHIQYEKMLELKRDLLIEALNRYTTINTRKFEIKKTLPCKYPFGYRNKAQLNLKRTDGKLGVAMIKAKSNMLVSVDKCLVQKDIINELNAKITAMMDEEKISQYVQKYDKGVVRYLVIRATKDDKALVCFVCHERCEALKEFAKKVKALPGVASVYENINPDSKSVDIFGPETNHLAGDKYVVETLGKIKYQIYPTTFFQLNSYQAEAMYDVVLKACKLSFKERVLDVYCGVGTIGLYLAHNAKEVVGIEYNKDAVMASNENAKFNHISNAKFLQGDAVELLPKMMKEDNGFDVLVCDPPRTGLGDKLVSAIMESGIKKVVYVSCNPATLARNLEVLKDKYDIRYITPLDMFPQTSLVESVTLLVLKEEKIQSPKE